MIRSIRFAWLRLHAAAVAVLSLATGCATAPGVYGNEARYSPAFQGYVMAQRNGSDDPGAHDTVLLLRDPLTGSKLRCERDVVAWRALYEDLADDRVEDDNAAVAAGVTAGALFGPLLVVHPVGALVLAEASMATESMYEDLASDSAQVLLARGIRLYKRQRFAQAAAIIEHALAKDAVVGFLDEAYLYLGLSYRRVGNLERARLALSLFVERAGVRDVDAYREAESALEAMGVRSVPCASRGPVALHW